MAASAYASHSVSTTSASALPHTVSASALSCTASPPHTHTHSISISAAKNSLHKSLYIDYCQACVTCGWSLLSFEPALPTWGLSCSTHCPVVLWCAKILFFEVQWSAMKCHARGSASSCHRWMCIRIHVFVFLQFFCICSWRAKLPWRRLCIILPPLIVRQPCLKHLGDAETQVGLKTRPRFCDGRR